MLLQKVEKSLNKAAVAEKIGCGNDIFLSKIGWGNKLTQKMEKCLKLCERKKICVNYTILSRSKN